MRARTPVALAAITVALGCGGGGSSTGTTHTLTSLGLTSSSPNAYQFGPVTTLTATAKDQNGDAFNPGGAPTFSDPSGKVTFQGNNVQVVTPSGNSKVTASWTAQGTTVTSDTVTLSLDVAPSNASVVATSGSSFNPITVDIKSGGTVSWSGLQTLGSGSLPHNVRFINATPFNGDARNGAPGSEDAANGTFGSAGTYDYYCENHGFAGPPVSGMSGHVVVH
ncbi:MAG TPA: plastocyanin/azurin family copper-binding protein [Gemmatimonadaceae bacterium]|nr:plastocyanin/azurin family copper-binding protein [Gemmatimonadaceae bacterium]